jgi:hypothetical protein
LHHGAILEGSTEYKAAARSAPVSGLASDFVAGANAAVHGEMTPTACEDEDRELRRQAILGMAHYRSARAFAVNPARLKGAPLAGCGDWPLSAAKQREPFMPRMEGSASLTPNQPEGLDKWIESSVWGSLPLTRKAPYKVKNRTHPAMSRVMWARLDGGNQFIVNK